MTPQREVDVSVLQALYARMQDERPALTIHRVRNRMTLNGFVTARQFDAAIATLRRYRMIVLKGRGYERIAEVTAHGQAWLLANFHWVRGDDDAAGFAPNRADWAMTAPRGRRSLLGILFGAKDR